MESRIGEYEVGGGGGRGERIQEAEAGEGRRQLATYQPHDNTTDLPHNSICTMRNTAATVFTPTQDCLQKPNPSF